MSVIIACEGLLSEAASNGRPLPGVLSCSDGWVQYAYTPPFDPSQIDPSVCTQLFGAGFLLYLTPWATAWGLKQLVKAIR